MKKLFSLLLILALLVPSMAFAGGIDLSAFSFEELVQLRQQIARELTTRPEWKEVTVPQGIWLVGEDIPAGHWTITAADRGAPILYIGKALEENGREVDSFNSMMLGYYYKIELTSPQNIMFDENKDISSFDIELTDGLYIQIKYASVIFSPFTGKQSLGF